MSGRLQHKLRGFKFRSFEVGSPWKLKLCFKYVIKPPICCWLEHLKNQKVQKSSPRTPGFRITSALKKPSKVRYGVHPLARTSGTAASSPNSSILSDRTRMNFIGPGMFVMSAISSHMSPMTVSLKGLKRRKIVSSPFRGLIWEANVGDTRQGSHHPRCIPGIDL